MQREMTSALQQYDFLISPTAPTPAYKVGEKTTDPLAMYKGGWPGAVMPAACLSLLHSLAGCACILLPLCCASVYKSVLLHQWALPHTGP